MQARPYETSHRPFFVHRFIPVMRCVPTIWFQQSTLFSGERQILLPSLSPIQWLHWFGVGFGLCIISPHALLERGHYPCDFSESWSTHDSFLLHYASRTAFISSVHTTTVTQTNTHTEYIYTRLARAKRHRLGQGGSPTNCFPFCPVFVVALVLVRLPACDVTRCSTDPLY